MGRVFVSLASCTCITVRGMYHPKINWREWVHMEGQRRVIVVETHQY